jgi:hypothetical protein
MNNIINRHIFNVFILNHIHFFLLINKVYSINFSNVMLKRKKMITSYIIIESIKNCNHTYKKLRYIIFMLIFIQ